MQKILIFKNKISKIYLYGLLSVCCYANVFATAPCDFSNFHEGLVMREKLVTLDTHMQRINFIKKHIIAQSELVDPSCIQLLHKEEQAERDSKSAKQSMLDEEIPATSTARPLPKVEYEQSFPISSYQACFKQLAPQRNWESHLKCVNSR